MVPVTNLRANEAVLVLDRCSSAALSSQVGGELPHDSAAVAFDQLHPPPQMRIFRIHGSSSFLRLPTVTPPL
jgi:hypothetical protein